MIYIAGPMRGYTDLNKGAFDAATDILAAHGMIGVTPFDVGEAADIVQSETNIVALLAADFAQIEKSIGICLLPGWQNSCGTLSELAFAKRQGKVVFEMRSSGAMLKYSGEEQFELIVTGEASAERVTPIPDLKEGK